MTILDMKNMIRNVDHMYIEKARRHLPPFHLSYHFNRNTILADFQCICTKYETKLSRRSEVDLNLLPTVSRSVRLDVRPPFGAHDQVLYVL
jgi:hypothetical protein